MDTTGGTEFSVIGCLVRLGSGGTSDEQHAISHPHVRRGRRTIARMPISPWRVRTNSALMTSTCPLATFGRITAAPQAGEDDDGASNVLPKSSRPAGSVRLQHQFSPQVNHMNSPRNKLLAVTLAASLASFFTSGCMNDGTRGNSSDPSGTSGASGSGTSATRTSWPRRSCTAGSTR